MFAAILVIICGACVITCCNSDDDNPVVSPTDDSRWHFTLKDEPFPDTYFTFPVKQLNK